MNEYWEDWCTSTDVRVWFLQVCGTTFNSSSMPWGEISCKFCMLYWVGDLVFLFLLLCLDAIICILEVCYALQLETFIYCIYVVFLIVWGNSIKMAGSEASTGWHRRHRTWWALNGYPSSKLENWNMYNKMRVDFSLSLCSSVRWTNCHLSPVLFWEGGLLTKSNWIVYWGSLHHPM